jgi:hypothetical protein
MRFTCDSIAIGHLTLSTTSPYKIDNFIDKDVFSFEQYDPIKYGGIRIFKSRLVREIKGKTTNALYEKSKLVIQGY